MGLPRNHVGRCIYCDSTENLTREHVIPQGLGGRRIAKGHHEALVLGAASCEECRVITQKFEAFILQKMMGHFRAATGLVHKNRKSETRPIEFDDSDGKRQRLEVSVDEIPPVLFLPDFAEKPGVLIGKKVGDPVKIRLRTIVTDTTRMSPKFNKVALAGMGPDVFGQMLAKIALGYAVSEVGLDTFTPLTRDYIRGNTAEFGLWIGGEPTPPETDSFHVLQSAYIPHEGKNYLAVLIRLFAYLGAPQYCVLVGEDRPGVPSPDRSGRKDRQ